MTAAAMPPDFPTTGNSYTVLLTNANAELYSP